MSFPKISVCIPTYNHENYIRDCIASVIQQDVTAEIEILIGDDHSTDKTTSIIEELVRKYNGRIRHIYRENNLGPFENLKSLVREAQGAFIAHLDGDDYWQPGKLEAQLKFLAENQDCVACYTNTWVIYDNLSPLGVFNNKLPSKFDLRFLLEKGNFLNHSSIFYRAEYKDCVLNCPESFIDYRIHIGLAMRGMLGYLNPAYVTYRHASSQSMIQRSNDKVRTLYFDAMLYAFENNDLADVYEAAFGDFTARIIKDGVSMLNLTFLVFWLKKLGKELESTRARIFLRGFFRGFVKLFIAVLRRIGLLLKMNGGLQVANER